MVVLVIICWLKDLVLNLEIRFKFMPLSFCLARFRFSRVAYCVLCRSHFVRFGIAFWVALILHGSLSFFFAALMFHCSLSFSGSLSFCAALMFIGSLSFFLARSHFAWAALILLARSHF